MKKINKSNLKKLESLPGQIIRGFTKEENDHWVAVCIDLNIVAQGESAKIARDKCLALCKAYIEYVCSEYPDDITKYIPRLAPSELMKEYFTIKSSGSAKETPRSHSPLRNFWSSGLAECRA